MPDSTSNRIIIAAPKEVTATDSLGFVCVANITTASTSDAKPRTIKATWNDLIVSVVTRIDEAEESVPANQPATSASTAEIIRAPATRYFENLYHLF